MLRKITSRYQVCLSRSAPVPVPGPVTIVAACVILANLLAGGAFANAVAYDTLEVGAHYTTNTNRNEYHRFWEPGKGLECYVSTPFHVGNLRSGFRYLSNPGGAEGVPDFQSAYVYAGWSYGAAVAWGFSVDPGFSIGVNVLHFEDEQTSGQEYESEIAGELSLRVSRPLYRQWRINATGSSFVMLTHRRIELFFVSAGISRSFSMPGWLRGFLE